MTHQEQDRQLVERLREVSFRHDIDCEPLGCPLISYCDDAADALSRLLDEQARLRHEIIRRRLWGESGYPCLLCGYDGENYYQPETHACAALSVAKD